MLQHCVSRWNVYILQKMIHGPSNVKLVTLWHVLSVTSVKSISTNAHWKTWNALFGAEAIFKCAGLVNVKGTNSRGNFNKELSQFIYRMSSYVYCCLCNLNVCASFLKCPVRQIIEDFQHHKSFHLSVQDEPFETYNNTAYYVTRRTLNKASTKHSQKVADPPTACTYIF